MRFKALVRKFYQRYLLDAMSAMALGLFASLIIGLILTQLSMIPALNFLAGYGEIVSASSPVVGAAIGAVIMSSISRLLVFIGLPSTYDNTITGIMLIVIVVVDALTQRRSIEMARRKRLLSRTAETAAEGECHQA